MTDNYNERLAEQNRRQIKELAETLQTVLEEKARKARKTRETKELEKSNEEQISEVAGKLQDIARQSGFDVPEPGEQAEKGIDWTERHDFFLPAGAKDRYMTGNPFEDR